MLDQDEFASLLVFAVLQQGYASAPNQRVKLTDEFHYKRCFIAIHTVQKGRRRPCRSSSMPSLLLLKLNLPRLVLALVILTALAMLATAFHASHQVQRQVLMDNALESNHAYAAKLAETTEGVLHSAQQQLAHSALVLGRNFKDDALLAREAERLWLQTDSFNSVGIASVQGITRITAPHQQQLEGKPNPSAESRRALELQLPLISAPYLSAVGNLIVFLTYPIFSPQGEYLGYVGGTIYLKQQNILNSLLGKHHYRDGSYLYVIDQSRRILYHPDPDRIGTVVNANAVIDRVLAGESGSLQAANSQGVSMLAGYAPVPMAGWGIVAQRPLESTLEPLSGLMLKTIGRTLPIALLALLGAWALAYFISRPLSMLAHQAHELDTPHASERIQGIRSWYFEAAELKRALLGGLSLVHQKLGAAHLDAQTDPLTGLQNRRGLADALANLESRRCPFSVLAVDIDHFKMVNDTYGHDMGDLVLRKLAGALNASSRPGDLVFRNGGEEFMVLLPNTPRETAIAVAERLRQRVAETGMPHGRNITVSLGVSHWPAGHTTINEVLKLADQALYQAKKNGRNQVAWNAAASD